MTSADTADLAILIGRFQPFHNGHAELLQAAMQTARRVIVILGSSFHARNPKNPFTWQERADMIAATLPESERRRLSYVPIRDYYDDKKWADAVSHAVHRLASEARHIVLVGHLKDASSHYLRHFPQWSLLEVDNHDDIDATQIRRVMFEAKDAEQLFNDVSATTPAAISSYLKSRCKLPCFEQLTNEHKMIQAYKDAWSVAPYPPIFTTVDAVVKAAGHVLLIKRGNFPGMGLWALPGGFVEQRERLLQAAIRELREETNLDVSQAILLDGLKDVKVFDHPDRSLRGRTITHAHFFELQTEELPQVLAADDAASASWVKIDELAAAEEFFFDDHFHILNHFLQLSD